MGDERFDPESAAPPADTEFPKAVRQQRILDVVRDRDFVSVNHLSDLFGVSEVTIRGDLQALEERAVLRRVRGGAVTTEKAGPQPERPFVRSLGAHAEEKAAIGRRAGEMISSGETLVLDVGTTTAAVAQALTTRQDLTDVVAFTNSVPIALALEGTIPRWSVVLTGGTLRPLQHSLVDPLGHTILEGVNVDTAFLGCNGVHPSAGVTNVNLPEATMKRRMIKAARRRIVVADGSKIGVIALAPLCAIDEVDVVITGASADEAVVGRLEKLGVAVEVVS